MLNVALEKQIGILSLLQKRIAIGSYINEGEKNDIFLITFESYCPALAIVL